MKIVTVIGARPQFIRATVVSRALHSRGVEELLIHTGQYYDGKMLVNKFYHLFIVKM